MMYSKVRVLTAVLFAMLAVPGAALAQTRIEVGATAHTGLTSGNVMFTMGDEAGSSPLLATGLRLTADLRPWPALGLGVLLGGAIVGGKGGVAQDSNGTSLDLSRRFLQAAATASWHPWSEAPVRPWLRLEGGIAAARDALGSSSVTQTSPSIGGTAGIEVALGAHAALTAELAVTATRFGRHSESFDGITQPGQALGSGNYPISATIYDDMRVWMLGVGVRWGWVL